VRRLRVVDVQEVRLEVPVVREACELLGIMPG